MKSSQLEISQERVRNMKPFIPKSELELEIQKMLNQEPEFIKKGIVEAWRNVGPIDVESVLDFLDAELPTLPPYNI
jgi:hypothetical protein